MSSFERYNNPMRTLLIVLISGLAQHAVAQTPLCKGAAIPILVQDGASLPLGGAIGVVCATLPAGWSLNTSTTPWSFVGVPVTPPTTTGTGIVGGPCSAPGTTPPSVAIYAQDPTTGVCFPIITVADPGFTAAIPESSPLNWMNPSRVAVVTDPPQVFNSFGQAIPQPNTFNAYGQAVAQPPIWPQILYSGPTLSFSHP